MVAKIYIIIRPTLLISRLVCDNKLVLDWHVGLMNVINQRMMRMTYTFVHFVHLRRRHNTDWIIHAGSGVVDV